MKGTEERPPLGSWNRVYLVLLLELALLVAGFHALTRWAA